ncbi:N-hydroxyarylamine O-acetyltransferase [Paenibacillus rhizosphaerae]|uniref:N-hydroxyarylamine O-acetyltransferase n=1 Tax=Paenibacillus rhizosphaerae TaxID=297318 RepID=A0A839TIN1_9BACL|nr:arylamine N-acetyltransferase [Paenibacillus rhizosphaerae]MBB3126564.1 N-hydroxyarylamine O-acetyltransferase [Paenibacillus rhizosphaerae]
MFNLQKYLNRLGMTYQNIRPDLKLMRELQYRHVMRIPFENLDIMDGVPLSMNPDTLFDKIIEGCRGGVCYELNGLFNSLLKALGFSVSMAACTVKQEDGWFIDGTHAVNVVHLTGGDYLVDVGFGGRSPRVPVPLNGDWTGDGEGKWRIRPYTQRQNRFVLEMETPGERETLYQLDMKPRLLEDFKAVFDMTQYGHESEFNKVRVAMIQTEQGRVTLSGNSLTRVIGETKSKEDVEPERIEHVLRELFHIERKE